MTSELMGFVTKVMGSSFSFKKLFFSLIVVNNGV